MAGLQFTSLAELPALIFRAILAWAFHDKDRDDI
jgi:hypothetical protein